MSTLRTPEDEAQARADKALAKLRKEIEHHTQDPARREQYFNLFKQVYVLLSQGSHTLDEFSLKQNSLDGPELSIAVNEFVGNMKHSLSLAIVTIEGHFWNPEKTDGAQNISSIPPTKSHS